MEWIRSRMWHTALFGGGSLVLLMAATAMAAVPDSFPRFYEREGGEASPDGTTITVSGEFWMEFQPVAGGEDGWWWLREDGATIEGSGYHVTDTAGDREPSAGYLCLDGEFMLEWRDAEGGETTRWTVIAECAPVEEAPTPTESAEVAPTAATTATPASTPGGEVRPVTGRGTVTPPPTDTPQPPEASGGPMVPLVVLALGTLAVVSTLSTPKASRRNRR